MSMIILYVWFVMIGMMLLFWVLYKVSDNASIIDVGWVIGLTLAGMIYLLKRQFSDDNYIVLLVLLIWAIRLGGFLWVTRISKKIPDKRYNIKPERKQYVKDLIYFCNYQIQGIFIVIISIPFYFIGSQMMTNFNWLFILGVIITVIGIVGESVADQQLYNFRQKNTLQVHNKGLWRYSRHPNYFFELCVWFGFAVIALNYPRGWIGLISPLVLYCVMRFITGPITEKYAIESRGEAYLRYQQQTPMIALWRFGNKDTTHAKNNNA